MKYTIEFELPDNDTVLREIKSACVEWAVWGYSGHVHVHPTIEERKTGRWIPCSERLPEEDKEVLISYRYKEGEGDTSHVRVDITTYGQMYFGGNKVGNHKHWRSPFEYFESNYEVNAWMPLPEPYTESEVEHEYS